MDDEFGPAIAELEDVHKTDMWWLLDKSGFRVCFWYTKRLHMGYTHAVHILFDHTIASIEMEERYPNKHCIRAA